MSDHNTQLAALNGTGTMPSVTTTGYWDNGFYYTWPTLGGYTYVSPPSCHHCWCSKTTQGSEGREHPKCCKWSEVGSIVPAFRTEGR